jgi:aldo/keto reductase family protein
MEYTKLGRTGLDVSRICLGCMSYGGGNLGNHAWSLPEEESRPFIKKALETGINFFDTADRYSLGNSEEILGRAIKDFARRDEVVIATKVYGRMRPGPNGAELSRKAIFAEIDKSLRRLGMGLCRPLSDPLLRPRHPIEERTFSAGLELRSTLRCAENCVLARAVLQLDDMWPIGPPSITEASCFRGAPVTSTSMLVCDGFHTSRAAPGALRCASEKKAGNRYLAPG